MATQSPPRIIEKSDPLRLVVTEAMTRVRATAENIYSGSLGVTGPRGVGKSTILQFFRADTAEADSQDLRLVVSAPVDYVPQDFIIHLFSQLCDAFLHGPAGGSDLPEESRARLRRLPEDSRIQLEKLAADSRRLLEDLRYLRTYTSSWSASLTPRAFLTLARGYTKQRAEQPITLPALVGSFREYSEKVASWYRSTYDSADGQAARVIKGARVIIGIDEVDKIRDSERAEAFLNDVKAIFGVPGCLYLVTLSEDALAGFARRTPTIRTAFDSAFDELVPVGPMTYQHSEEMLFKRVTGVPRPFLALCYVLAGGLPRDLVRGARALIGVTPAEAEKTLPETASALINRELESLRQVSIRQLAESGGSDWLLADMHDLQWPGVTPHDFNLAARRLEEAAQKSRSGSARQQCLDLAVALSFYETTLELFSAQRQERLMACFNEQKDNDEKHYAIIDDLAAARYATRVNAGLARQLLERYRQDHGMSGDEGEQWHQLGQPFSGRRGCEHPPRSAFLA